MRLTVLSLLNRWLYIHVPRTGGNSLQHILLPYSDDVMVTDERRDGIDRFEITGAYTKRKHMTMQEYCDALPRSTFDSLMKFAVVRNPFERAISQYFGPIGWIGRQQEPVFEKTAFISTLGEMDQMVDMLSAGGHLATDLLLRFERLPDSLSELFRKLGITRQLPHVNKGFAGSDWRQYYRQYPELVDEVARRFERDIKAFEYDFDRLSMDEAPKHTLR